MWTHKKYLYADGNGGLNSLQLGHTLVAPAHTNKMKMFCRRNCLIIYYIIFMLRHFTHLLSYLCMRYRCRQPQEIAIN